ncbi:hypothetical protein NC651_014146 [Populus alba x Populus x berolinensis]|nr:hypothetical protein NC651_014146 [Populus alba x Populus x berolinensis]
MDRPTRKSLKRKLEQDFEHENQSRHKIPAADGVETHQNLTSSIQSLVDILNSTFSSLEADRAAAKRATSALSQIAKNEEAVDTIVDCGAVPALVLHLQTPPPLRGENGPKLHEHEVEKGSAYALGLLAVKPEHQQLIVDAGALTHLVELLKRHKSADNSRAVNGVVKRAADAITNLAHENSGIKTRVRIEGAIPFLVELLEHADNKVQRAAAEFYVPTDRARARCQVGVIGNLVHSSPHIKKAVLLAGALQPVIGLLSSSCSESQREAALLLGQFAAADSDCKVHIVQRGAVKPLIDMLESSDVQLKEMSAFALGRLAQETHNQAGIAHNGGIVPLLRLLDSKSGPLQHNAAFTLYGLVDNEDNVADLIKVGGFQKLQDGEFIVQQTKDCVTKTMKRLEEKIHGRVLNHLLYLMRVSERNVQRRIALALAHLCTPNDRKVIFLHKNGLDLLLGLLESGSLKQQREGSVALYKLATKATLVSPVDSAPLSPNPLVYLGEQYVNNPTLSDVTFLVEGKRFYAHRICLLASSDAFRAMFDGGYRERNAKDVEIPNIRWDVFELMMRFIYTGSVEVNINIAQDLLRAADQYLLDGLKRLCECTIAQDISVENVSLIYELSEGFNAMSLREACILFILEQFDKLCTKPCFVPLRSHDKSLAPDLRARLLHLDLSVNLVPTTTIMEIKKIVGGKSTPSWQGSGNDVCGGGEETDWYDFETDLYHWTKPLRPVQWYPGHIAKTEKELKEQLKLMDVVIEVRDARIPLSTTHPQMDVWLGNRKRILVLNREDMISKADRNAWATYFARQGIKAVYSNGQLGMGTMKLSRFAKSLAASVRAGIVGYPNVGKSSLINRLLKRRMCPAAPRPGVTRELRWVRFGNDLELLDSPGIIPMRISDQSAAIKLAICDDIGERSYDVTDVAAILVQILTKLPTVGAKALNNRYKMDADDFCGKIFVQKLSVHLFNGDTHQAAFRILSDFRKGKFGWAALERPPRSRGTAA